MNTFICYDRCSTCQKAEAWLISHSIPFEKRPVKEKNPSSAELKKWASVSGLPLRRFFNTSGLLYKKLELKEKLPAMSEADMLTLLETDGMLVKRPILITDESVLLGFRPEEWARALIK